MLLCIQLYLDALSIPTRMILTWVTTLRILVKSTSLYLHTGENFEIQGKKKGKKKENNKKYFCKD